MKLFFLNSILFFALQPASAQTTAPAAQQPQTEEVTAPTPQPAPEEAPDQNKTLEKIAITGSYIKRVSEEGPAAVVVISKEEIQRSGQNSVGDVMRNMAITGGATRETSGSNQAGVSTTAIRGFGSGDILVLLNSQRLPKVGGGNTVDLNMIPISAIERVEILKDGASALYGSDALGGVINFITKKDYNGASIMARYSLPEEKGGNRFDMMATGGYAREKFSVMGVFQYRNNGEIFDRDRYFSRVQDVKNQGSTTGSPGSWVDGTTINAGSAADPCPPEKVGVSGHCMFDYSLYSTNLPSIEQYSAMVTARYNFTEKTKFSLNTIYNKRNVDYIFAPGADRITNVSNAQATALGITPAAPNVTIIYRTVEELGTRNAENVADSYIAQPVFEFSLGKWDFELSGSYGLSQTKNTNVSGYANRDGMKALMTATPTPLWNPFAAPGAKGNLNSVRWQPWQTIDTSQTSARLVATSQIWEGGDIVGPIAAAVGVSADRQDYIERTDFLTETGGVFGGGAGSRGEGDRNFQSAFTEFSYFATDQIEAGIAMRYDKFSDFGDTFNPKMSLSWNPNDKFLFKASVGTGFRAPNLNSLYGGQSTGFSTFVDRKACNLGVAGTCRAQQWLVESGGNRNLKEETSIFYNLGMAVQPKKNWNIEFNTFYAVIDDRVGISLRDLTRVEELLGAAGVEAKYGIRINRLPNNRIDSIENARVLNLSTDKTGGFDFTVRHEMDITPFGKPMKLRSSFDHQHIIYSRFQSFEELPGEANRSLGWRNVITSGIAVGKQRYTLIARTYPSGDKSLNESQVNVVGYGSTYLYTEYDFDFAYLNLAGGDVTAGIRNVFNSKRPLDDTVGTPANSLNTAVFDPIGRQVYLGYTYYF